VLDGNLAIDGDLVISSAFSYSGFLRTASGSGSITFAGDTTVDTFATVQSVDVLFQQGLTVDSFGSVSSPLFQMSAGGSVDITGGFLSAVGSSGNHYIGSLCGSAIAVTLDAGGWNALDTVEKNVFNGAVTVNGGDLFVEDAAKLCFTEVDFVQNGGTVTADGVLCFNESTITQSGGLAVGAGALFNSQLQQP